MQIVRAQQKIVEKILRDKEGRLVRARFSVYENAGRIKARLIDVRYLDNRSLMEQATLSLPGFINKKIYFAFKSFKNYYRSPFLSLNSIFYSGSKPRAPTFA